MDRHAEPFLGGHEEQGIEQIERYAEEERPDAAGPRRQ